MFQLENLHNGITSKERSGHRGKHAHEWWKLNSHSLTIKVSVLLIYFFFQTFFFFILSLIFKYISLYHLCQRFS